MKGSVPGGRTHSTPKLYEDHLPRGFGESVDEDSKLTRLWLESPRIKLWVSHTLVTNNHMVTA